MTQAELNRAVAAATGEALSVVRRRGFSLTTADAFLPDPEDAGLSRALDWDELHQAEPPRIVRRRPRAAA